MNIVVQELRIYLRIELNLLALLFYPANTKIILAEYKTQTSKDRSNNIQKKQIKNATDTQYAKKR